MRKVALCGLVLAALTLVAVTAAIRGPSPDSAGAASHREAPLISLDAAADNTDTYFFRSYEPGQGEKIVMVMNVLPGEEPSAGPNYYNFDPNVKYVFNVDNNQDGRANDVVVSFDFKNEIRGVVDALGLPVSYLGGVGPVPPITALDGPGSEGLGLRQRYSVRIDRATGPFRTVAGRHRPDRRAVERRPEDDAELRRSRSTGHLRPRQRDQGVRGPAE